MPRVHKKASAIERNGEIVNRLLAWYARDKRSLPWRVDSGLPDAYQVLVSELMLQQTQVATVIDYFRRFIDALPTIHDLAAADEQQVLRLWQGLGYYSRARNLHKAARLVVSDFAGEIPQTVDALLTLPGVGRYTAGAIASLAFGRAEPILDGNVMRVLCRLDAVQADPRHRATTEQLWQRASDLVTHASTSAADFNSGLMELGATVCTPRNPSCLICPVRASCRAFEDGLVDSIPPAKLRKPTPAERRDVMGVCRRDGGKASWLVEQRPATGRWANLWQFVTREYDDLAPWKTRARPLGQITHQLTHRHYTFDIYLLESDDPFAPANGAVWADAAKLDELPMPRPHLKIRQMFELAVETESNKNSGAKRG